MPTTITKTVYSFAELLDMERSGGIKSSVVDRVRDQLRSWNTDHDWYEFEYTTWASALNQIGFVNPEIHYSGFWSQGDGASFTSDVDMERLFWYSTHKIVGRDTIRPTKRTGKSEDFLPWVVFQLGGQYGYCPELRRYKKKILDEGLLGLRVRRDSYQYAHENTCSLDIDSYLSDTDYRNIEYWLLSVADLRVRLCRAIYSGLETEYTYLTSDEALLDLDSANGYRWDIQGHIE